MPRLDRILHEPGKKPRTGSRAGPTHIGASGQIDGHTARVVASLTLTSLGVYVGRFLRWNSWDVFFNPIRLGRDLVEVAADPLLRLQIVVITLSFMVLFVFAYVILFSLPRITADH